MEVYGPHQAMTIMVIVFYLFLIWFANFLHKERLVKVE